MARDSEGEVFLEALISDTAGSLHILTDMLESVPPTFIASTMKKYNSQQQKIERNNINLLNKSNISSIDMRDITINRYSKIYWLTRALKYSLPPDKMNQIGLQRLNSLRYKIVGQSFALEHLLSEVASFHVNTELSEKPLVMLFSGPPGK